MARYKLISCEIFRREVEALVPRCGSSIDLSFLPLGLHAAGSEKMAAQIQAALDAVDPAAHDAVLLLYGLCSYGIRGLHSTLPLVVSRAHDCITLFMGSRQRYRDYFDAHAGTFYATAGIMDSDLAVDKIVAAFEAARDIYRERYDEEDVEYLMESMGNPLKEYNRIAYIDNGVGTKGGQREKAGTFAATHGWTVEDVAGESGLIERLLSGSWDPEDFLVLPPGSRIEPSYEEDIVQAAH
jgi:hypothetical protein